MDFTNAAIVVGVVMILTASVKDFLVPLPEKIQPTVIRIFALLVGFATLLLMRESNWGDEQILNGLAVSDMSVADCAIGGLFLGVGAAGFLHEALKAVHNIGENKTAGPAYIGPTSSRSGGSPPSSPAGTTSSPEEPQ